MADYQEYRRRVLRKRWRRRFMAAALLLLLLLVGAIGMLWKSLHREQRPSGVGQNTILQEVTQDNTWNTASYAVAGSSRCRRLQTARPLRWISVWRRCQRAARLWARNGSMT